MKPFSVKEEYSTRIKFAWAKLPAKQKARVLPVLESAHAAAVSCLEQRVPRHDLATVGSHFALAHSVITNDRDGILSGLAARDAAAASAEAPAAAAAAAVPPLVDAEGVIWGTKQYENLDPGWLEAFAVWLEHLILPKHPFNASLPANNIPMDTSVRIALAGDWATGFCEHYTAPSQNVKSAIESLAPDFTIHLGDVYYTGTDAHEQNNLAAIWPKGAKGSLALNSNHEMHPGGGPYFNMLNQAGSPFSVQHGRSFFALENEHWIVVGLDSAYYAEKELLYSPGTLCGGPDTAIQLTFLRQQAAKGKTLIVLTHHNPLDLTGDGSTPYTYTINKLGEQMLSVVPPGSYWYWGHVHAGAVFKGTALRGVFGRCCGHGGIPWGAPAGRSAFANPDYVEWWGNTPANDADMPERLRNGLAVIDLNGPNISERFFDEKGCLRFQPGPR